MSGKLLLLDLDGVVALECDPPIVARREILRLHRSLDRLTRGLGERVVVVTHRSRAEAWRILKAVGVTPDELAGVRAAEDLLIAGLSLGALPTVLRHGLRKSLILPGLAREMSVLPRDVAFIDDVERNIDDLLSHGIGLGIHVPSHLDEGGEGYVSFDLDDAVAAFEAWRDSGEVGRRVAPAGVARAVEGWSRTGLCTTAQGDHLFNRARRIARRVRVALQPGAERPTS